MMQQLIQLDISCWIVYKVTNFTPFSEFNCYWHISANSSNNQFQTIAIWEDPTDGAE